MMAKRVEVVYLGERQATFVGVKLQSATSGCTHVGQQIQYACL